VPRKYDIIADRLGSSLDVARAGAEMGERREYLFNVSDVFVMMNGGFGTLDEAYGALRLGKRVITLPHTGGAASLLHDIASNKRLNPKLSSQLSMQGLDFDAVDPKNVTTAKSVDEAVSYLRKYV